MAPELHGARFLKILKSVFKSFKKFKIKILDVDNRVKCTFGPSSVATI
jgi:hypothetical protein